MIATALFVTLSCSDKTLPPIYQDPEVIVDISGNLILHYEALGYLNNIDNVFVFSSTLKTDTSNYSLFINFYFNDYIKSGEFQITNAIPPGDSNYVVIVFTIADKESVDKYISTSGSATITSAKGSEIKGTFQFIANEEKSGKQINATNGKLNIIQ